MNSKKFGKLNKVVYKMLVENEELRSDDVLLYAAIIDKFFPSVADCSFIHALTWHKDLGLPSYESVSRVRRRVQASFPDLQPEKTREARAKEYEEYFNYSKDSVIL